jgi:hypothetical protein
LYRAAVYGPLSRARPVALVAFGRVLLAASPEMTEEEKEAAVRAFRTRCLKNCFWLLMLLYPGVCKKARAQMLHARSDSKNTSRLQGCSLRFACSCAR